MKRRRPLATTGDLRRLVEQVIPAHRGQRIHPATRVFQALRIAVNDEYGELVEGLGTGFGPGTQRGEVEVARPGRRKARINQALESRRGLFQQANGPYYRGWVNGEWSIFMVALVVKTQPSSCSGR